MKKILVTVALAAVTSIAGTAFAQDADGEYSYDFSHHNDSPNSWTVTPEQVESEDETYETQAEINETLDYLNSGTATEAPSNDGEEVSSD